MINTPGFEFQKSVDDVLTNDDTLLNMLGDGVNSILDNPAQIQNVAYPFITYESIRQFHEEVFDENYQKVMLDISVSSRAYDTKECWDIINRIDYLLNRNTIKIFGYKNTQILRSGVSNVLSSNSERISFLGNISFSVIAREEKIGINGTTYCPIVSEQEALEFIIIPEEGKTRLEYYNAHGLIANANRDVARRAGAERNTCYYLATNAEKQRAILSNFVKHFFEINPDLFDEYVDKYTFGFYGVKFVYK